MTESQAHTRHSSLGTCDPLLSSLKVRLYRGLVTGESWDSLLAPLARVFGAERVWLVRSGDGAWEACVTSSWTRQPGDTVPQSALLELARQTEKWLVDDAPLIIDDLALDPRIDSSVLARCGTRSLTVVPLGSHGKRVGTLYLGGTRPCALDHSDLPELKEVAAALAYRLSNEAVVRCLQQKRYLHQAVGEATRVMLSDLGLQPTLQLIVDLASEVTGRPACWIALYTGEDPREQQLEIAAARGISPADARHLLSHLEDWPVADICSVRVAHGSYRIVSVLPIAAGGTVLGSLGLAAEEDVVVNRNACLTFQTFCRLAALAIFKGRMQRKLEAVLTQTVHALLAALEVRNPEISSHSQRVSHYLGRLAEHVGVDSAEVRNFQLAGLLHDIGKIALPQHLLSNEERLSPAEWETLRQHPIIGSQIISSIHELEPLLPIIQHQYEHYDGTGWPSGIRGPAIPLGSRALAVADTFDSFMSRQPQGQGRPLDRATALLKEEAGKKLDPHLVAAFLEIAPTLTERFRSAYEASLPLPASRPGTSPGHLSQLPDLSVGTDELTPREREVLSLIALGLSNKEIAAQLVVSEKTVKTHVMHIFQKLGVQDRTRAALYAIRRGMVHLLGDQNESDHSSDLPSVGL